MLCLLGGLLATLPLSAGSIGPVCGTCFGGVYTIDISSAGGDLYDVELTADLRNSTFTADDGPVWVRGVSVNASSGALVSGVLTSTTAAGTWTDSANALATPNGCQSAPGSGSVCATTSTQLNLVNTAASLWTWIFRIEAASLKTDELPFHLQVARMNPRSGRVQRNFAIVSESIPVVATPEGTMGELPLLLSGLVGVWFWNRRRAHRAA